MRKLIYIPIIHMGADLGSVASDLNKQGEKLCGEERWRKHRETVSKFWDIIVGYVDSLDAKDIKIYQDGLVADGEMGMKIVQETAKKGSKNYELIARLIGKGATIVKTEDVSLIKEEYNHIMKMAKSKSFLGRILGALGYKLKKGKLLRERDEFIAKTIDETLKDNETGILFLGAHHDVLSKLPEDIQVKEVKERDMVSEYQRILPYKRAKEQFDELAGYIISPIEG